MRIFGRSQEVSAARREPLAGKQATAVVQAAAPQEPVMAGKYSGLHKYLENRYANTVVLTFAQMEDLLGFALPDLARFDRGWWTNPHPAAPYARAWILANRTATPNLPARTVSFERAQV